MGKGDKWLTSRLFISAIMMQRMRGVQGFVFVESTATSDQRLVAVAPVSQLRWALAQRYLWLELVWVRANMSAVASPVSSAQLAPGQQQPGAEACWLPDPRAPLLPSTPPHITSDTGGFPARYGATDRAELHPVAPTTVLPGTGAVAMAEAPGRRL